MTPRATDWTLAALVSIGFATGGVTLYAGGAGDAWMFTLHGCAGLALAAILVWKLRRVAPRLRRRELRDAHSHLGVSALVVVALALTTGTAWASGITPSLLGVTLLGWHEVFGVALMLVVVVHASARPRLATRRNPDGRRDFLRAGLVAGGAFAAWQLQAPAAGLVGLRSAARRFTGSYEAASFEGNAFPSTSWVGDRPRALDAERWRLAIDGRVTTPMQLALADLDARDELTATLDCTGGFYSTQRWRGVALGRLLAAADPQRGARYVRVISTTGYRWSYVRGDAEGFLLATHVGGEPLSHEHGAPLRLIAPGRRGFEWVKWVVRLELADEPDPGAAASTVWSSLTREGRGA